MSEQRIAKGPFQVKRVALPAALEAHGRSGAFVLQHSATMDRGTPMLTITVVPDTGTDALTGLSGSMRILIDKGQHSYEFEYRLSA